MEHLKISDVEVEQVEEQREWDLLPAELKCKILASVPTSRHKLALNLVSKDFRTLLDSASAHGLEAEPLELPLNRMTRVSRILAHVRALQVRTQHGALALPPSLERLNLHLLCSGPGFYTSSVLELPKLRELELEVTIADPAYFWHMPLTGAQFPALRSVRLPACVAGQAGPLFLQSVAKLGASFKDMPSLERVSYRSYCFHDMVLPPGCALDVELDVQSSPNAACVVPDPPESVTQCLTSLHVTVPNMSYNLFQDSATLSLAALHPCEGLAKLVIFMPELGPFLRVMISGINELPRSVRALEIVCRARDLGYVCYSRGTRIDKVHNELWPEGPQNAATTVYKKVVVTRM